MVIEFDGALPLVTFILRCLVGIIVFGISYQSWRIFNLVGGARLADLARKVAVIFLVFGTLRVVTAFPDIYTGGILSNLVNDVILGWFLWELYKKKEVLERNTLNGNKKLSDFLDEILAELNSETPNETTRKL